VSVGGAARSEDRPLAGWRVAVTGDTTRTSDLGRRVAGKGAEVVQLPVVAVVDPIDGGARLRTAADRLVAGEYDWVVVTSANGVDRLRHALVGRGVPSSVRFAAVGPSTGRALDEAGLPCHLAPEAATSDALGEVLVSSGDPGRALYPRAERVRGGLAERLRAAGWETDDVVAYRTVGADPDPASRDAARRADAVLFTSGSAVEQTVGILGVDGVPSVVVTIGPSTSSVVRASGLEVTAEARSHSAAGLVETLIALALDRGDLAGS